MIEHIQSLKMIVQFWWEHAPEPQLWSFWMLEQPWGGNVTYSCNYLLCSLQVQYCTCSRCIWAMLKPHLLYLQCPFSHFNINSFNPCGNSLYIVSLALRLDCIVWHFCSIQTCHILKNHVFTAFLNVDHTTNDFYSPIYFLHFLI